MDGSANDTWSERPPLLRPAVRLETSGKCIFGGDFGSVGVYRIGPNGIGSVVYHERYLLLILSFLQSWQCKVWKL